MQLLEDREDAIVVIDEIDYACKHEAFLGAILDIVDETLRMKIEISERLIDTIHFNCNGKLRKAIKLMYILESRIKQNPGFSLENTVMAVEL